jgi:hypothetical protein
MPWAAAADSARMPESVEDFVVADVEHRAAGFTDGNHGLPPVERNTNSDTTGDDTKDSRGPFDEADLAHLAKSLPDGGDGAAVADRDGDPIGRLPVELLADFEGEVGVDGAVAVVPAQSLAGSLAELEGVVVAALDADDGRSEDEQPGEFRLGRALGDKDDAAESHGGGHSGERKGGVAVAGAGDDFLALGMAPDGTNGTGAVLQGAGGVAAIVLYEERGEADVTGKAERAAKVRRVRA